MSLTCYLLPRRRALATHIVRLTCGLSLLVLGGYAQATEAMDARAIANQTSAAGTGAKDGEGIRPFHILVSAEQLDDLRKRIAAVRWPDKETVNDDSQGIQLAQLQALVRYWGTDY